MQAHQTTFLLFALSLASAMASATMTSIVVSLDIGPTFYGCANANGAVLVDSLEEKARPICRRGERLVLWNTNQAALVRM
jgi:hypothetical protein